MTTAVLAPRRTTPRRTGWWWLRPAATGAVLAVLVWRLGTGPFVDGLRAVDATALAAGFGIAVLTTVCCAWRWRTVARGFGAELSLSAAVAAYYRSLFLNVFLPGGVIGDVDRGITHGVRAVILERSAGQVVQIALTVGVLLVLASPAHDAMPLVALALIAAAGGVALAAPVRRWVRRLTAGAWACVGLASALIVAGHTVTFLIAARTAGASAPLDQLLPLALLVLFAAALPNIGGWGPREGMTAWAFSAAGLGASRGVATAVVYGVMVLVATLPGAAVLLTTWGRRHD